MRNSFSIRSAARRALIAGAFAAVAIVGISGHSFANVDQDAPYSNVDPQAPYSNVDPTAPYSNVDQDAPYSTAGQHDTIGNADPLSPPG